MTPAKDRPETDPHVRELGGFDVTNLSIDRLKAAGVTTGGIVVAVKGEHAAWKSHSEFIGHASGLERWDVIDRAYARRIAAAYVKQVRDAAHAEGRAVGPDALRGLKIPRSFPCMGVLRILEQHGRSVTVSCDACGETFGVKTEPDPRDEDEKPTRRRREPEPTPGGW